MVSSPLGLYPPSPDATIRFSSSIPEKPSPLNQQRRNKRKLVEPRRVNVVENSPLKKSKHSDENCNDSSVGQTAVFSLKKRLLSYRSVDHCEEEDEDKESKKHQQPSSAMLSPASEGRTSPSEEDNSDRTTESPFRPWHHPAATRPTEQLTPPVSPDRLHPLLFAPPSYILPLPHLSHYSSPTPPVQEEPLALVKKINSASSATAAHATSNNSFSVDSILSKVGKAVSSNASTPIVAPLNHAVPSSCSTSTKQKNYKNMTREKRAEANARERNRVHQISAAYDKLSQLIPTDIDAQKLSKLSIIKIASAYILTLSRMAGLDYSLDQSAPTLEECVGRIKFLVASEGKISKGNDALKE